MSKSATWENALLLLEFNNVAFAGLGDAGGLLPSAAPGSYYLSWHTASPGEAGDQTTSEATYTSYARTAISRNGSAGFTVTGSSVSPTSTVNTPACTGGSNVITHFGLGTASSGAGKLTRYGPIGTRQGAFTALASSDTFTIPGITGVAVNDNISFFAVKGQSLPTGITAGTLYFVKTVSGTQVTISATAGGATIDITTDGEGYAFKNQPITVTTGITPQFSSATTITED